MDKVYEIYIKETLRWFENNINELDICYKKIRKMNEKITDKEVKGLSERIALDVAGMFREYSEKLNELREIHIVEKSIIESLRERVQLLEIENARLKEENKFKIIYVKIERKGNLIFKNKPPDEKETIGY